MLASASSRGDHTKSMEIIDYFREMGRRFWVLLALPLVGALLPVGYLVLKPATYVVSATVLAPAVVGGVSSNQYRGADSPKRFASNFEAALRTPTVLRQVSAERGVPLGRLRSGLNANQIEASSFVHVDYRTSH